MLSLPANFTCILFILVLVIISNNVMAADYAEKSKFDRAFQDGIDVAKIAQVGALERLKTFNPSDAFDHYTKDPAEEKYYQKSDITLKNDVYAKENTVPGVEDIRHAEDLQGGIDKNSLKREVDNISQAHSRVTDSNGDISDEFKSCKKIQSCTTSWTEKSCEAAPDVLRQQCTQRLNVSMVPDEVHESHILSLHLYANDHTYAGVTYNAVTGNVVFLGPHEAKFSHTGSLPASAITHPIKGEIIKIDPGNKFTHLDNIQYPSVGNPNLSLHISGSRGSADLTVQVRLETTLIVQKPSDQWVNGCSGLESQPSCSVESSQCTAANETRDINGIPITRDCWEKSVWYSCTHGQGMNACTSIVDQGCEQVSMICADRGGDQSGACVRWHRVYHCPVRTCRDTGVSCQGETYCLEGDCLSHDKKPDGDFQRAMSALSGSLDGGEHFDGVHIFGGNAKSCDDLILGAANCCRDSGWLVDDLSLYHCSPEEKELGRSRENGQTHYVGKEESALKKTRTFCVFPSLLARIIQEQGRDKQLNKGFGTARHPDCEGITPEDLQKVDFSRIDFSDFYADLEKKKSLITREEMAVKLKQKMQELIDEGKSHDKKIPA